MLSPAIAASVTGRGSRQIPENLIGFNSEVKASLCHDIDVKQGPSEWRPRRLVGKYAVKRRTP